MAIAPASAWIREWLDIIRYIIFPDAALKDLMMIPAGTDILKFNELYFIRAGYTSKLLTNEDVRVIYSFIPAYESRSQNIIEQELSFDIYVKQEHSHDYGDDRLMKRAELIAERLNQLIGSNVHRMKVPKSRESTETKEVAYKFRCIGMSDMGTATIGYVRYNISFKFMRTI